MNTWLLEEISIKQLGRNDVIPYELLLDADPSIDAIEKYLETSEIHVAVLKGKVIASIVLYPLYPDTLEIKNIAVDEGHQGNGIGRVLLNNATQIAIDKGMKKMVIGTSNSSIGQLYLYQSAGFEIADVVFNFFLDNYPEPIFENGIQCKHMIMLKKTLW